MKEPKITFIIHEAKDRYLYPSVNRARNFIGVEAKKLLNMGIPVTVRVVYGRTQSASGKTEQIDNEGRYECIGDLKAAYRAFMDKDLWLE